MAEHKEHHEHNEHHDHKSGEHSAHHAQKNAGMNYWMAITAVLAVALVATLAYTLTMTQPAANPTGLAAASCNTTNSGNADKAALSDKALKYVNDNFLSAQGMNAVLIGNELVGDGMLKVNLEIQQNGETVQEAPVYVTVDGKSIFLSEPLSLDTPIPQPEPQEPPAPIAKTDKPSVELYVMSYCPYGNQAEEGIIPALKLLGDSVDFKLRYIVSKSGDSYNSLHGNDELEQDVRELCIQKHMPDKFLDYILAVNKACSLQNINDCWKTEAEKLSIDTAKIEKCAAEEKTALLDAEIAATEQYSVSGSPTTIINGGLYTGGRTAEAFKQGMCSAFNNAPEACNTTLDSTGAAATGNC